MDIDADGFCSLMDPENSETKDDIRIPDGELGDQIRAAFEKDDCGMNVSSATKVSTSLSPCHFSAYRRCCLRRGGYPWLQEHAQG